MPNHIDDNGNDGLPLAERVLKMFGNYHRVSYETLQHINLNENDGRPIAKRLCEMFESYHRAQYEALQGARTDVELFATQLTNSSEGDMSNAANRILAELAEEHVNWETVFNIARSIYRRESFINDEDKLRAIALYDVAQMQYFYHGSGE